MSVRTLSNNASGNAPLSFKLDSSDGWTLLVVRSTMSGIVGHLTSCHSQFQKCVVCIAPSEQTMFTLQGMLRSKELL
jgi:hypothetical protein